MSAEILVLVRDCLRIAGVASGLLTIYMVYYRSLPNGLVRRNAGRISGFVVLWWASLLVKLFSIGQEAMLISSILIQAGGLAFCWLILGLLRSEKKPAIA